MNQTKLLNRARSVYSDEYFISEDIKFELGMMYLRVDGKWRECEKDTRSIHFSGMQDSNDKRIFASLNPNGTGADLCRYIKGHLMYDEPGVVCKFIDGAIYFIDLNDDKFRGVISKDWANKFEVLSILEIQE